jgi:tetratricopeptide (TPR) repeat protein
MGRAAAAAEEGLELSVRAKIEGNLASSLRTILGFTAEIQGDYERATKLHEEALALSRKAADKRAIADSLLGLGGVWNMRGDPKRATEFFEEGIVQAREVGDADRLQTIRYCVEGRPSHLIFRDDLLLKPSEKGCQQRSKCEFSRYNHTVMNNRCDESSA